MNRKATTGYIFIVGALILPYTLVYGIEPEWVGRMIAVVIANVVGASTLMWVAFDKNAYSLKRNSVGEQLYGKSAMKKVEMFVRGFFIVIALFLLYVLLVHTLRDVSFLVQNKHPFEITSKIEETSQSHWDLGGILQQTIWLHGFPDTSMILLFHYPSLYSGDTYQFLYVPHSMQILEVREIHGTTSNDIGS